MASTSQVEHGLRGELQAGELQAEAGEDQRKPSDYETPQSGQKDADSSVHCQRSCHLKSNENRDHDSPDTSLMNVEEVNRVSKTCNSVQALPLGNKDEQPDPSDLDAVGTDDVDIGRLRLIADFKWFLNHNLSLLDYCRDKELYPDLLCEILTSGGSDGKRWNLDGFDKHGYAAIHYIVMKKHSNKPALLEALIINGAYVDLTCQQGLTALHLAAQEEDLDCVKTLISLDADVNMEDSIHMGRTPLDLARYKKGLVYALNKDIKLEILESGVAAELEESLTASESIPLAKKSKLQNSNVDKIIQILESVGARKGSSSKANLSTLSSIESTSSQVYVDYDSPAFRKINTKYYRETHDNICATLKEGAEFLDPNEAVKLVTSMRQQELYRRKCGSRILCLDGGGIRGLLQMTLLREIERQTGKQIVELFDWIVGTSTGGIIALSLSYGPRVGGRKTRKTVSQLRDVYWLMKDEIFGENQDGLLGFLAKGNTKELEKTLKGWLGEDVRLHHETYPKVLIPAVFKKHTNLDLRFFNNCFGDEYSEELVWKVGRYTSAAPFYFTEFENYIDGGMLANNPSEAALTVIQDHYHDKGEKIPISLLVSVGSGVNPGSPLGEIDIKKNLLRPRAYLDLMEVLESAVIGKQTASSCLNRCREQGIEYFRFNPDLKQKVDSDQHKSQILQDMILTTRQYLRKRDVKLDMDRLVQLLKDSELTST